MQQHQLSAWAVHVQTRQRLFGLLHATATGSQPSVSVMLIGPRGVGKTLVRLLNSSILLILWHMTSMIEDLRSARTGTACRLL